MNGWNSKNRYIVDGTTSLGSSDHICSRWATGFKYPGTRLVAEFTSVSFRLLSFDSLLLPFCLLRCRYAISQLIWKFINRQKPICSRSAKTHEKRYERGKRKQKNALLRSRNAGGKLASILVKITAAKAVRSVQGVGQRTNEGSIVCRTFSELGIWNRRP